MSIEIRETNRYGLTIGSHQFSQEIGNGNRRHVLGQILGDVIVSMSSDDAVDVLQAVIARLGVLDKDALKPFGRLAMMYRAWDGLGEKTFSEFVNVEETE
jgi:hypothetical protein